MADEAVRCRVGRAVSEQPIFRPCRNRGRQRPYHLAEESRGGRTVPAAAGFHRIPQAVERHAGEQPVPNVRPRDTYRRKGRHRPLRKTRNGVHAYGRHYRYRQRIAANALGRPPCESRRKLLPVPCSCRRGAATSAATTAANTICRCRIGGDAPCRRRDGGARVQARYGDGRTFGPRRPFAASRGTRSDGRRFGRIRSVGSGKGAANMGSRPAATRRLRHRGTRRYGGAGDFGACTTIGRRIRRFAFRCSYRAAIRTSRRAAGTAVDALRPVRFHRAGTQSDTPQAQKSSCASPKTDRSAVDVRPACTVGAAARRSCFRAARTIGARGLRP